jgi:pyruvate dehydrogenase E2 component (dihydrolipoamide acetyltransferase)
VQFLTAENLKLIMIEITVPRLGWSMDEGTFAEWLKRDGEWINPGDMLFVLESEKAAQEIESFDAGTLRLLPDGPEPGDVVKVGQTIGYLVGKDEVAELPATKAMSQEPAAAKQEPQPVAPVPVVVNRSSVEEAASSPRARRVAKELGVDLKQLTGSGKGGRIREQDVRAAVPSVSDKPSVGRVIPASSLRRTIAERMLISLQTTAPVTLTRRVDATNLQNLRQQFAASKSGSVPTVTAVLIKLTAIALKKHELLNSRWEDDQIVVPNDVHMGIAVDTPQGLLVPVIPDVQHLSLLDIAARLEDIKTRSTARKLTPDELRGGTFTISNLGRYGIETFTPIINTPESAILGVGTMRREAVVLDDDRIVPRDMLWLSLTFDHRVVDGAPAAEFLQTLAAGIENPAAWLLGG